ncbi:MAG: hypothetical protein WAU10_26615 [Caldilineaceae bacterium]
MADTIQQRLLAHDRFQVEIRHFYRLQPSGKSQYRITTYIFLPQSLGIHSGVYSQQEFYRRIQNYVRLRTPDFTLEALRTQPRSPLVQLQQILGEGGWERDIGKRKRVLTSLKFLRAILNSRLERRLRRMDPRTGHSVPDPAAHVSAEAGRFMADVSDFAAYFRGVVGQLAGANVGDALLRDYRLTDESISLVLRESYLAVYLLVEKYSEGSEKTRLQTALGALVEQESAYRLALGSPIQLVSDGDNEEYIFRSSALKKFTSSVLYLSASVEAEGRTLEHLLFSVVAGISMIFATVIAFYFQARFDTFTFPVFVALVVGYMFKDRIKETGRLLSTRILRNFLYDRRITLETYDHSHELGYLREKVSFVAMADLPEVVRELRRQGQATGLEGDGQAETVISYTKSVTLFSQRFESIYPGGPALTGINDILRLDVRPFLHKMADPVQRKPLLKDGHIQWVRGKKVYHVHLVSVIEGGKGTKPRYTSSLLTLNRKGIVRVKSLATGR